MPVQFKVKLAAAMRTEGIRLVMPESSSDKQESKSTDDIALELMKFIAVTTGYGKGTPSAGFGGKGQRSSEEYADALLELFERCRTVVNKPAGKSK